MILMASDSFDLFFGDNIGVHYEHISLLMTADWADLFPWQYVLLHDYYSISAFGDYWSLSKCNLAYDNRTTTSHR